MRSRRVGRVQALRRAQAGRVRPTRGRGRARDRRKRRRDSVSIWRSGKVSAQVRRELVRAYSEGRRRVVARRVKAAGATRMRSTAPRIFAKGGQRPRRNERRVDRDDEWTWGEEAQGGAADECCYGAAGVGACQAGEREAASGGAGSGGSAVAAMRKRLKQKKRACSLCKPQKMHWSNRWTAKEEASLKRAEREIQFSRRRAWGT